MLYSGFTGPSDWAKIKKINTLNSTQEVMATLETLEDKRLIELYKRKLYSENKSLLSDKILKDHRLYISEKITNDSEKVPWTTLSKARIELAKAATDTRFAGMSKEVEQIEKYLDKIESKFID